MIVHFSRIIIYVKDDLFTFEDNHFSFQLIFEKERKKNQLSTYLFRSGLFNFLQNSKDNCLARRGAL